MATYEVTVTGTNFNVSLTPVAYTVTLSQVGQQGVKGDTGTIESNTGGTVSGDLTVNGDIIITGVVDGRDVAADGTKLDGIESGATADQTAAEIKTAYESNADTNAFTDAEKSKLAGIETNADVTDTANVTAAGALMDSELTDIAAVKALDQGVATTDSPTFVEVTAAQYNSTEALPDIKPSLNLDFANTKALDPRITYTRGSTATYYDGKTFAKAEENLLTYSQEFDNAAWVKDNTTVTANSTTAPDGTSTADTFSGSNATSNLKSMDLNFNSGGATGTFTASFFAKADTHNFIQISFFSGVGISYANFDVLNGVAGNSDNGTPSIVSVGNGWYRCVLSSVALNQNQRFALILVDSNTSGRAAATTTTNGLYLWGAQLEQRSALTDYTATTTQPITNYVPALQTAASGEPRFDHDPITGESKGFLIEEQRTNLVTYSEQFDNAAWSKTGSSVTSNIVVAPDGTLTGDKLVEDTSTGTHRFHQQLTTSAGEVTTTYYVKAAERSYVQVRFQEGGSFLARAEFNLSAGEATSVDGSVVSIQSVGNGWYRISLTATSAGSTTFQTQLWAYDSTPTSAYTGDGYSGIYIWGAQLEQGSFPTSYIPTVASQVTRSPDAASMTGTNFSSWYRQDEGTMFVEFGPYGARAAQTTIGNFGVFGISSGTFENGHNVFAGGISGVYNVRVNSVNSCYLSSGTTLNANGANKLAGAYKTDDFARAIGGAGVITDTSGTIPQSLTQANIGKLASVVGYLNGHIKKLAYYPKRLSNATLQALTEE